MVYFLPKEEWIGISDRDFVGPILDFIYQQSLSPGDAGWAAPVWPGESAEMGRMFREGLEECVKGYLEMNKALGWKRGWWDRERAEEILGEIGKFLPVDEKGWMRDEADVMGGNRVEED